MTSYRANDGPKGKSSEPAPVQTGVAGFWAAAAIAVLIIVASSIWALIERTDRPVTIGIGTGIDDTGSQPASQVN
jgi:hypothetical protein